MATFPIQIDARTIFGRAYFITGVTPDWVSSREVHTLQLAPGTYQYQAYSGGTTDLRFDVTAKGTVAYDHALDAIVSGRDTNTLTVQGVEITLDARYLSELGILLTMVSTDEDWIMHQRIRLVPAPSYSLIQGSAQPVAFSFAVGLDGVIQYDPTYDVAKGGFARGLGSSTLELLGYPILVDARAAGGAGLKISPGNGLPFTTAAVQLANLLPPTTGNDFRLQIESGAVTPVGFSLGATGQVVIDAASARFLRADTFHGVTRLTVTGPLPRQ